MRGEFEFIERIRSRYRLERAGDDCAVLPQSSSKDLVITADLLVEEIDFRLEWSTPEQLGHKALAVSLSDIAAMGGTPKWALTSIAVPGSLWNSSFLDAFYEGLTALAGRHNVELVGGDISRSPERFSIDSVVLGEVGKDSAILRSTARSGDRIFVTGYIGGAAAGLQLLHAGQTLAGSKSVSVRHLLLKQLQPLPQVQTGILLQEYGLPSSMIDLSDGLSSDLDHIISASGVGARIDLELLPTDPSITAVFNDEEEALHFALHGGEDFELLFTTGPENESAARDLGFHMIGEVTANCGGIEVESDGTISVLEPGGFRHF